MSSNATGWPTEAGSILNCLTAAVATAGTRSSGWLAARVAPAWPRQSESTPSRERLLSASRAAETAERSGVPLARQDNLVRFHRLVLPHLDAAYNFARFLSRDAEGAQDVVQEAAMRAFRNFDGFQGGDPRAWLFAIVRNCHHDRGATLRRNARFEVALDLPGNLDDEAAPNTGIGNLPTDEDTPEDALLRKDAAGRVRTVLMNLQDACREVLVLRELEALSYREIAAVVGIPIGTVMSRLARARRDFAEAWRAQDIGEGGRR